MAFLIGVKRCSKLDRIKNEGMRQELQVFDLNDSLKVCKRRWLSLIHISCLASLESDILSKFSFNSCL